MYTLPKDFTGLNATPLDFIPFKKKVYELSNAGILKVIDLKGYTYPKNYYEAVVSDGEGSFSIYLNCYSGVFGFGSNADAAPFFIAKPQIAERLAIDYQHISADLLNEQVIPGHLENLEPDILKTTQRWLPATIGMLLFAWYFD